MKYTLTFVSYVGANPPANTLVQIQRLADPAYKVEIEAIAVLP